MQWLDWKGVKYSLPDEWEYVNGPAKARAGCTAGTRDLNNEGKMPGVQEQALLYSKIHKLWEVRDSTFGQPCCDHNTNASLHV